MITHVTNENYEAEVLQSDKPVLLDFGAPWCVPCKKVFMIMEELAAEQTEIKIAKVDIEASPEIAVKNGIISIPSVVFFKNGEVVGKIAGVKPKAAFLKLIYG